ncbi:MAG: hypothetical protein GY756_04240 [bacterium]|nr:hypothetical protein [bacterium]
MARKIFPKITHVYQNHHLDSTRRNVYKPRDNDIIISSSYKSGTTWAQSIIRELIVYNIKKNHLNTSDMLPLEDSNSSVWVDNRTICDIKALSSKSIDVL